MSSSGNDKSGQKKSVTAPPTSTAQTPNNVKVKQKKLGHRRVDASTGQTTYKKTSSEALSNCIQLGISHTVAKLNTATERDVLMQDFQVVESIPFPANGSPVTPAHHHGDFVFSTYAPTAFRYFRGLFGIQPEDYMLSISRYPLVELSNPGASGSLFFVTHDDEFIIKTVQAKEATFLQQLLPGYYMNIVQNPRTLLPKFYGLYNVNAGTRHNIRIVVMNNLLPRKIQMHLKFDLKGSTYKRKASKTERTKKVPTLKDLDLLSDYPGGLLQVSSDIHEVLIKTLESDCLVLQSFKIMDYSLLLAIHNIDKCKTEALSRGEAAECLELSNYDERHSPSTLSECSGSPQGSTTDLSNRLGSRNSNTGVMGSSMLRNRYNADLDHWSGGIPAKNKNGDDLLIFCGIIDILQCYKWKKKFEHSWKSIVADGDSVSVHNPKYYCVRFLKFMDENVITKDPSTIRAQQSKRVSGASGNRKTSTVRFPANNSKLESRPKGKSSTSDEAHSRVSSHRTDNSSNNNKNIEPRKSASSPALTRGKISTSSLQSLKTSKLVPTTPSSALAPKGTSFKQTPPKGKLIQTTFAATNEENSQKQYKSTATVASSTKNGNADENKGPIGSAGDVFSPSLDAEQVQLVRSSAAAAAGRALPAATVFESSV